MNTTCYILVQLNSQAFLNIQLFYKEKLLHSDTSAGFRLRPQGYCPCMTHLPLRPFVHRKKEKGEGNRALLCPHDIAESINQAFSYIQEILL